MSRRAPPRVRHARLRAGFAGLCAALALPAVAQSFSTTADGVDYYRFAIDEDALAGAPDLSALNHPLGPADRLVARDGHFWAVGADGRAGTADDTRVRLFGASLSFSANFPAAADAPRLARRLRKLGFNAVRLHHLDSLPGNATPPASVLTDGPFPSFNPAALARLRTLIGALGDEGLYVNLNLRVGYRFRPEVDQVPPLAADAPTGAPVHAYHPRMIALQQQYARALIGELGLRDAPALAMVEISNESSLVWAWRARKWEAAVPPAYAPALQARWQDWLKARYGSVGRACAAWGTCPAAQTDMPLIAPADAGADDRLIDSLRRRVTRAAGGLLGGDTPASGAALRTQDFLSFLADTDRAYFDTLRQTVRDAAGDRVPVTGTQMAYGGVLNFDSNAGMDYIDEHFYVDHPESGADWQRDWWVHDLPTTGDALRRVLGLSLRRARGKPFVVSEFNQPFPNRHGAGILPAMALVGAMQDWDALFFFDYAQDATWPQAPSVFSLAGDWGKYVTAAPAAALFRGAGPAPLPAALAIPLDAATRRRLAADTSFESYEAGLAARGATPALAWTHRLAMDLAPAEGGATLPAPPAPPFATPDGTLRHDAARGLLTYRGPQDWIVIGTPGEQPVEADGIAARFTPSAARSVALLLRTLDARPVNVSRRLLVTLGGATTGTQPGSQPLRPKALVRHRADREAWTIEPDPLAQRPPSGPRSLQAPAWVSRTATQLDWVSDAATVRVYPLDGAGRRQAALPATAARVDGGRVRIALHTAPASASPWYEVVLGDLP